jgi:hypothetical protein
MNQNKDSNSINTKDSSQNEKPKIFRIKKINLYSLITSPILNPFIINNMEKYNYIIQNPENCKITNKEYGNIIYNNFNLDKMINEIEKTQINSTNLFHQYFHSFKKIIRINNKRQTEIDSFLKKCKSKFSKAFSQMIYKLLKNKRKIYKMPQAFVTDINIDINKRYLNCPIFKIYEEYNVKINFDVLKKDFYNKDSSFIFFYLMNRSYKSLFEDYLNSKKYSKDCLLIRKKKGIKFEILFRYVSKIFIKYYSYNKGNKINISQNNIYVNIHNNE